MSNNYDASVLARQRAGEQLKGMFHKSNVEEINASSGPALSNGAVNWDIKIASNEYVDLSAMHSGISFRVDTTVTSYNKSTDARTARHRLLVGPKVAGALAWIDSLNIKIDNTIVSSSRPHLSLWNWLRYMFTTSYDAHLKLGPLLMMAPCQLEDELNGWVLRGDTPAVINHNSSVRPGPTEYVAPLINDVTMTTACYNKALFMRCVQMAYPSQSEHNVSQRNTFTAGANVAATAALTSSAVYTSYMYIPLQFLSDFFKQAGIIRGVGLKIQANITQVSNYNMTTVATTSAAVPNEYPGGVKVLPSSIKCQAAIVPFQQTELANNAIVGAAEALTGSVRGASQDYQQSGAAVDPFAQSNSNLYNISAISPTNDVPVLYLVKVVPTAEDKLKINKERRIFYLDYDIHQLNDTAKTGTGSTQITGDCSGFTNIFMLGYVSASEKKDEVSPFFESTSEPYLSSPAFAANNFLLKVGGDPVLATPFTSEARNFAEGVVTLDPVLGGQSNSLGSGLYSRAAYNMSKIYVWNVSNLTTGTAKKPISISFKNASLYKTDIIFVSSVLRHIVFDGSGDDSVAAAVSSNFVEGGLPPTDSI